MLLDDLPCCGEVDREQVAEVFGIEGFADARGPHDVGEEDRDEPTFLCHEKGGFVGGRGRASLCCIRGECAVLIAEGMLMRLMHRLRPYRNVLLTMLLLAATVHACY